MDDGDDGRGSADFVVVGGGVEGKVGGEGGGDGEEEIEEEVDVVNFVEEEEDGENAGESDRGGDDLKGGKEIGEEGRPKWSTATGGEGVGGVADDGRERRRGS